MHQAGVKKSGLADGPNNCLLTVVAAETEVIIYTWVEEVQ